MPSDFEFEPSLLDMHLGALSASEKSELRSRIAGDPRLQRQDEALSAIFAALHAAREEPLATPNLMGGIMRRIDAAGKPPRIVRPADGLTRETARGDRILFRFSNLRDVIAAAALIVFAVGVGVPGMLSMRERNMRMMCTNNLRQVGVGMQQYAGVYNSSLPFAGWSAQNSWQPSRDPAVQQVPNRRHVYRLLWSGNVAPGALVCPSVPATPLPANQVARHSDFPDSRNVSYAYYNMAGVRPSLSDSPALPVMADDNPLFEDGFPLFDVQRLGQEVHALASGRGALAERNSRCHRGAGQNLLSLGGHVTWSTTPRAGLNGDNIWLLNDVTQYTGKEGPRSTSDAHLLK